MRYTQGNWVFSEYSNGDLGVYSETGNGNDIALVRRTAHQSIKETEANAKLISAAPELLESLKTILKEIDYIIEDGTLPESAKIHPSYLKAQNIINKATL